jgi:nucleotide-binding universal stress UspA family protein
MINRILVPLDGSKLSEQALTAARGLAAATGSEIVLLTAIARQDRWANLETPAWEEEEEATATGYLDVLARELRDAGFKATTRVAWGRPSDTIRQIADESNADVIVMTTHGRSGITRFLIGSVADNVLRTTERPLFLVRAQNEPPTHFTVDTILVPLDGSRLAESGLPFVKKLAQQLSADVVLARAIVPPALLYGDQYLPSSAPVMEDLEAEARDYLETQRERVEDTGLSVKTVIDDGFPVDAIVSAADRTGADLIVLTSHGRTGPTRTILGSVADGLVRQAHCPCLVIPARAAATQESELHAPSMLGIEPAPTVIPTPTMSEFAVAGVPKAKAPAIRPHRPEGVNRRKA